MTGISGNLPNSEENAQRQCHARFDLSSRHPVSGRQTLTPCPNTPTHRPACRRSVPPPRPSAEMRCQNGDAHGLSPEGRPLGRPDLYLILSGRPSGSLHMFPINDQQLRPVYPNQISILHVAPRFQSGSQVSFAVSFNCASEPRDFRGTRMLLVRSVPRYTPGKSVPRPNLQRASAATKPNASAALVDGNAKTSMARYASRRRSAAVGRRNDNGRRSPCSAPAPRP